MGIRSAGPKGFTTVTPTVSARTLDTVFQPSTTNYVKGSYSVRTQVTNPLLAGISTCTVTLFSDAANPPTIERCRVAASSSNNIAVAFGLTTYNTASLDYIVPPGHYVRMVSAVVGTGVATLVSQTEEVFS